MTDLTTLDAVKAYASISTSADDGVLKSMIAAYSEWVRSYTSRDFTVSNYDMWRSGRGSAIMLTTQFPINDVTLVEVDGTAIPRSPQYGSYGYRFTDQTVVLDGGACFTFGVQNVHIQFTAGYASVPVDIAQAVNELVTLRYRTRDKMEWNSKSLAGEIVSINQRDMPASVSTILRQYTNPVPL